MFIALGFVLCLVGGALIETPIIGLIHGEFGVGQLIFGVLCGAMFLIFGAVLIVSQVKDMIKTRWELPLKKVLEALKPGFREATTDNPTDKLLVRFRTHYADFFGKWQTEENEEIQGDVTQVFRNMLQLRKNRLNRLGLICSTTVKRMAYTKEDGLTADTYSDGKYRITDVTEEVAAKTVYRSRDGKAVYTKVDRDLANYTVIRAQQVGADTVICPSCGAEATRDALLDGCDYCGTKFAVEDLDNRIAVFAFRPDTQLRYEKYRQTRNKVLLLAILAAAAAVFLGFCVYAIVNAPTLLAEADGGVILTVLSSLFAVFIASPVYLVSFFIAHAEISIPLALVLGAASIIIAKKMKAKKRLPMLVRAREDEIRNYDANFSIANFYSGVQNKLSSVLFAENRAQLQAFAAGDLTGFLGKYSDVVGVDVDHLDLTAYSVDAAQQHAEVDAYLYLTRYRGAHCRVRREKLHVTLAKAASCKTQVLCAPAVLRCKGCGTALDLLQGKHCPSCGRELDLMQYDWAIQSLRS